MKATLNDDGTYVHIDTVDGYRLPFGYKMSVKRVDFGNGIRLTLNNLKDIAEAVEKELA